jgi:vancomycin resistance protein VanJ
MTVTGALRFIGERWWLTGVGLYFPRYVFALPLPLIVLAIAATRGTRHLLWTQALAGLVLFFPLMGAVLPLPAFASRGMPVVRVLSFNVDGEMNGVDRVVSEIDRFSPDVVVLQEVGMVETLGTALRARFSSVTISGQFLVATKYSVVSSFEPEKVTFDGGLHTPRFFQQVMDTPIGRIALYDLHPVSPREGIYALFEHGVKREVLSGRLFTSPNSGLFVKNMGLRSAEVQGLAEALAGETNPVVIAGDTNLPGLSHVFNEYLSRYQDGFVRAGWGFGYTYPTNHGKAWMRIDRILADEHFRFVQFQVGRSLVSDHFCVVADLQKKS